MEIDELDDIIEQTEKISNKLKEFKELAKTLKKQKEKKKKEPSDQPIIKERKIKENQKLYRGGLNLYQYKESAIKDGFQNPVELVLKDVIRDLYEPKPKPEKQKKVKKEPENDVVVKTIEPKKHRKQQKEKMDLEIKEVGGAIEINKEFN